MSQVIDKLESIGISVNSYKRGPNGKKNFAISIDKDRLRIWEGDADISVSTNKRKRQAVLTVHEKARKIITSVNISLGMFYNYWADVTENDIQDELKHILKSELNNRIRNASTIQVPNARIKVLKTQKASGSGRVQLTVEFFASQTTISFLVGFDTHALRPFISQLRNVVSTVQGAHKELLPEQPLRKGYKRQGEWFFNPVDETLDVALTKNIKEGFDGPIDGIWKFTPTTHNGFSMSHNKKRYAIGTITDRRKDRHLPLFLPSWHEVIRNNEVEVIVSKKKTWD